MIPVVDRCLTLSKLFATETENMSWTIQNRSSPVLCHDKWILAKKRNMEQMWNGTSVLRYFEIQNPGPLRTNTNHIDDVMMILTDFWKQMKQPEFHPPQCVMVQVPVHPLLLETTKGDRHISTSQAITLKDRLYHKTISFVLAVSFFEV